jgi:hypothetical protein
LHFRRKKRNIQGLVNIPQKGNLRKVKTCNDNLAEMKHSEYQQLQQNYAAYSSNYLAIGFNSLCSGYHHPI